MIAMTPSRSIIASPINATPLRDRWSLLFILPGSGDLTHRHAFRVGTEQRVTEKTAHP